MLKVLSLLPCGTVLVIPAPRVSDPIAPIRFELKRLLFQLESDESDARNTPETMLGGGAIFDYDGDGRPDIFFINGANIATLKKDSPKIPKRSIPQ